MITTTMTSQNPRNLQRYDYSGHLLYNIMQNASLHIPCYINLMLLPLKVYHLTPKIYYIFVFGGNLKEGGDVQLSSE